MKHAHGYVLRTSLGDCTNGGASSRRDRFTIFWDCTMDEALAFCEEKSIPRYECLWIHDTHACGREYLVAEPMTNKPKGCVGPMFGGNYIGKGYSSFPHYSGLPDIEVPIPIHDRFETPEEYAALSI